MEVIVGQADSIPDLDKKQYCGVLVQYPDVDGDFNHSISIMITILFLIFFLEGKIKDWSAFTDHCHKHEALVRNAIIIPLTNILL